MSLSPDEKRALRQRQGLLAGTRQWSMPRLSSPVRRSRRGQRGLLFAVGLLLGLIGAIAVFIAAVQRGWI